jgi:hypothetical protein
MFRFGAAVDLPADLLFKSLNWRRGSCAGNRIWSFNNQRGIFRYFGNRRRSYPSGSWLFRYGARLRCTPNPGSRCGLPVSPGISDQRTCDRADWSQNERSRSSASSALLSLCFERDKRPCDYRRNKQFLHGGFLEYAPRHRTSRLRQHKGDPTGITGPNQTRSRSAVRLSQGGKYSDMAVARATRTAGGRLSEGWSPSPCASPRTASKQRPAALLQHSPNRRLEPSARLYAAPLAGIKRRGPV